jgi:hypothetical protein
VTWLVTWLAVSAAWAGEAPPGEAEATTEEAVAPGEATLAEGPAAPAEETGAAAEGTGEGESAEGGAGEAEAGTRPPGAGLVDKLRERADKAPPAPGEERLDRAAQTASRIIRPLPTPFAIAATVVGFILMLFGQRLFRTGIVLYFMALVGMIGREVGQQFGDFTGPLVGGCAGCVIGAGVALPLRALVRALVGGLTGGILASILVQSFTSDLVVTLVMVAVGIAGSGLLTFFFPKPLLVIGFSLFGAVTASIGILSVATDPVMIEGGAHLAYGGAHIAGVILATALGVLFQSHLGDAEEEDD